MKKSIFMSFICVAPLMWGTVVAAAGDSVVNIAVLDLEPRGGLSAEEILSLSDRLRGEFVETGKFTVLERSQMDQILKEQGFQQTGVCSDASCMVEMGQLLAVQKMVGGSVGKVGKVFSVNLKIIDVKTGRIEKQISDDYQCLKEELVTVHMRNLARKAAGLEKDRKRRPFIARWYFWAPVAAVAAAGGGVYVGMTLTSKKQEYDRIDITIPVTE